MTNAICLEMLGTALVQLLHVIQNKFIVIVSLLILFLVAVLLIIAQIVLLIVQRKQNKFLITVCIGASVALSFMFAVSAYTAVGQWDELLKSTEDRFPNVEYNLGYSWILMLFSGLLSTAIFFLSILALARNQKADPEGALNVDIVK